MWQAGCHKSGVHRKCSETAVATMYKKRWNHSAVEGKAVLLLYRLISWMFFLNILGLHVVTRPAIGVEQYSDCLSLGS